VLVSQLVGVQAALGVGVVSVARPLASLQVAHSNRRFHQGGVDVAMPVRSTTVVPILLPPWGVTVAVPLA
jgi:hypothetical protein